jgi:protein-disulfide isomerase
LAVLAVVIFVAVLGALLLTADRDTSSRTVDGASAADLTVREDSRILGKKGSSDVVLVEFLDFECEACGAAYPVIEDLREKYDGRVTFVARYFPLPGHFNAERAARAVESAARQGKLDQMYQLMYETQTSWGEKQEPADDTFRNFAVQLKLDMDRYDVDYASPEVAARVQRDVDDGLALGVQGTPTFFLNGERFEPAAVEDFSNAIDEALAE